MCFFFGVGFGHFILLYRDDEPSGEHESDPQLIHTSLYISVERFHLWPPSHTQVRGHTWTLAKSRGWHLSECLNAVCLSVFQIWRSCWVAAGLLSTVGQKMFPLVSQQSDWPLLTCPVLKHTLTVLQQSSVINTSYRTSHTDTLKNKQNICVDKPVSGLQLMSIYQTSRTTAERCHNSKLLLVHLYIVLLVTQWPAIESQRTIRTIHGKSLRFKLLSVISHEVSSGVCSVFIFVRIHVYFFWY